MTVDEFIGRFRKGSIRQRLPGELLEKTVEEAIQSSSTARKLLINNRFVK